MNCDDLDLTISCPHLPTQAPSLPWYLVPKEASLLISYSDHVGLSCFSSVLEPLLVFSVPRIPEDPPPLTLLLVCIERVLESLQERFFLVPSELPSRGSAPSFGPMRNGKKVFPPLLLDSIARNLIRDPYCTCTFQSLSPSFLDWCLHVEPGE